MSRQRNTQLIIDVAIDIIYAVFSSIRRKYSETKVEQAKAKAELKAEEKALKQAAKTEKKRNRRHPLRWLRIGLYILSVLLVVDILHESFSGEVFLVALILMCMAVLSGFILFFIIGLFLNIGSKRFRRFKEARGKGIFSYFLDKGVFLQDKHFWVFTTVASIYVGSCAMNDVAVPSAWFLIITCVIPVYVFCSVWLNMLRLDAVMPAINEQIPLPLPEEPKAEEVAPVPTQVSHWAGKLRQMCSDIEDEELISNVQQIVTYTETIETVLEKYPDAKKEELVREYTAQLLHFLDIYNEAEDLRLTNKASLSMMENTRKYAEELVVVMQNILEMLYESNVETIDINIDVMRREMRMRGLVKDE